MANRRWTCPRCGSGLHAPGKMRLDDTRRYCLTCSESTGRLVRRTCPALDNRREKAAALRRDKARAQKEREKIRLTEHHTVDGLDVREEWKRLCAIPWVRSRLPKWGAPPLTIAWSRTKDYTTGHARYSGSRVHLTLYPSCGRAEACAILAHELAHVASPVIGHGEGFRRTFARILELAYGIDPASWPHLAGDKYDQHVAAERAVHAALGGTEPLSGRLQRADGAAIE